jgi:hypothetical protein
MEMLMLEKRDYEANLANECSIFDPKWSGSLYYDTGSAQWWVLIPFPKFTAVGRDSERSIH